MPALSGGKKTEINTVESAINTALTGLNPNVQADAEAMSVLKHMRKMLTHLQVVRTS